MCHSGSQAWTNYQVGTATVDCPYLSTDILSYSSITHPCSRAPFPLCAYSRLIHAGVHTATKGVPP